MMHIPVDDQHPLQPVDLLSVSRRDGHVVEQAETHGPIGHRMVARRPHQGERA